MRDLVEYWAFLVVFMVAISLGAVFLTVITRWFWRRYVSRKG